MPAAGPSRAAALSFENGHLLLWTRWSNPEDRPLYERRDELIAEYGQAKADWMIGIPRNLCLYPNVYLMDQFGCRSGPTGRSASIRPK